MLYFGFSEQTMVVIAAVILRLERSVGREEGREEAFSDDMLAVCCYVECAWVLRLCVACARCMFAATLAQRQFCLFFFVVSIRVYLK